MSDDAELARPYEPSGPLRWLYGRFFSHIAVDGKWSDVVRDSAKRGVVVYVMRSLSLLDFLCLDFLTKRFSLPLLRFVNDLGLWILEPFGRGDRRLRFRRQIPEDRALAEVVRQRHSALLFLRRPPALAKRERKGGKLEVDLLKTLVETQRQMEEPILIVPQTFVWSKRPPSQKTSILDLLFGPSEWPGRLRVLLQFVFNFRNALLRSGEPFDLQAFVHEHQDLTDAEMADKIRYALLRRMERERALVLGPVKKSGTRIREELLRSPRIQHHIASNARAEKRPVAAVQREADRDLRKLVATPEGWMLALYHRVLDRVWNRIYDGIVIDEDGIERVRAAAREGTLILLPSHKSHVDYLVLSDVFWNHALNPPVIAAGDNLSFWPLGPVLRRGGAFFIRRTFKGKKLYAALVDAYIRKLMLEGFSIELFLEGGRSRTGKLLPPKLGLLSMIVDAALSLTRKRVFLVPVSIGYERIAEERSYVNELTGGEKQKEDLGALLRTRKVLKSRYGRLYIQFGEVLSFDRMLAETAGTRDDGEPNREPSPPQRRALVQKIAHRVVHEIDRVTMVTPASLVATAMFAHRRRGLAHSDLVATCRMVVASLLHRGARLAPSIANERGELRPQVVDEALRLFHDAKLITTHATGAEPIHSVPEDKRLALEIPKNNILHFFVPSALIATALLGDGAEPASVGELRERVRKLSRLFKYEFMYRADAPFDEIFDDALRTMLDAGELERMADRVRIADGRAGHPVQHYANLLRTYFESYRLAVRGAETLLTGPQPKRDWLKKTLALGERMYLAGEVDQRESLAKSKLENALLALRDHGVVKLDGEQVERGSAALQLDDVRGLESRLAAYAA